MGVVATGIISKIVLLNARSLNNKLPELHKRISENLSMLFITNGMLDCSHSYVVDRMDDVWNKLISPLNNAFEAFVSVERPAAVGWLYE